jgi:hypothetical protein
MTPTLVIRQSLYLKGKAGGMVALDVEFEFLVTSNSPLLRSATTCPLCCSDEFVNSWR